MTTQTDIPARTDWRSRNAAVVQADGDEWDSLNEAFSRDWKAAYSAAFVEIAVSRGWSCEDAETWPENIADDALIDGAPKHDWCPRLTAEADVVECERQAE